MATKIISINNVRDITHVSILMAETVHLHDYSKTIWSCVKLSAANAECGRISVAFSGIYQKWRQQRQQQKQCTYDTCRLPAECSLLLLALVAVVNCDLCVCCILGLFVMTQTLLLIIVVVVVHIILPIAGGTYNFVRRSLTTKRLN